MMPRMHAIASGDPLYLHIRVVLSLILGLAITTLLKGMTSFIQHPKRHKWSAIHLGWALWAFVSVTSLWWWQYRLTEVGTWTFNSYFFELMYCSLYFVLAAILFPDDISEYSGYQDYVISRRHWLFGLIWLTTLVDIGDSWLKGADHLRALGIKYEVRIIVMLAIGAVGVVTTSPRVHRFLVVGAVAYQLWYTLAQYALIGA